MLTVGDRSGRSRAPICATVPESVRPVLPDLRRSAWVETFHAT